MVYLAPMKSLCSERFCDWFSKFKPLGLNCMELTGDSLSSESDLVSVAKADLVLATPEKWDVITRRWRDYPEVARAVRLIMIDEVNLNDLSVARNWNRVLRPSAPSGAPAERPVQGSHAGGHC